MLQIVQWKAVEVLMLLNWFNETTILCEEEDWTFLALAPFCTKCKRPSLQHRVLWLSVTTRRPMVQLPIPSDIVVCEKRLPLAF